MNRVTFGASHDYFGGSGGWTSPTICMNNEYIVQANISQAKIYTRVAKLSGKPEVTFSTGVSATHTSSPNAQSVSIGLLANDILVLIYANNTGNFYYRIGFMSPTLSITWSAYEIPMSSTINGMNCDVAVNDNGTVVLVYEKQEKLYYVRGALDITTNQISWQSSHYYCDGIVPSIAINNHNDFIEVHQSENHNSLYYNLGKVESDSITIQSSGTGQEYKSYVGTPSVTPSVAMNSAGLVLEVHESGGTNDSLYYMQFQFNHSTHKLDLQCEQRYSIKSTTDGMGGKNPVVACNDNGDAFQLYQTENGNLFGCLSKIWDRSNWMSNFHNKTLKQLCIPGSHDAGMSTSQYDTLWASSGNTVTQIMTIADQLERGLRYFDLRPAYVGGSSLDGNNIYTGHYSWALDATIQGACGEKMADVLTGVKNFLTAHPTEVVILKFSHYYSAVSPDYFFDDRTTTADQKQPKINSLIDLINSKLGSTIYTKSTSRLADTTLGNCAGKAIIVFDMAPLNDVTLKSSNIYQYLDYNPQTLNATAADLTVFDKYSNTNSLNVMTSSTSPTPVYSPPQQDMTYDNPGQFYLLENSLNHGGDLFLLSWTLTLSWAELENPAAYNIVQLSQLATSMLAQSMVSFQSSLANNFPNIIYVDAADGFVTDVCVWINNLHLK
jgi:hypothetical protein